jgi:hypothetical protein
MGFSSSEQYLPPMSTQPPHQGSTREPPVRPNHKTRYPFIDYVTGEITWIAFDKYDSLLRNAGQKKVDKSEIPHWSPSKSKWQ